MQAHPIAVILIIPTLIFYSIIVYVAQHRKNRVATMFLFLVISFGVYTTAYMFELVSADPAVMLWCLRIEYIGIAFYPAFLVLVLIRGKIAPLFYPALFAVPAATLALVWTSPWHDLFFVNLRVETLGILPFLDFDRGPWYWVQAGFIIVCFLSGALLALFAYRKRKKASGAALILFYFALIITFASHLLSLVQVRILEHIDPTPFSLSLSALLLSIALFRFELFHISPPARLKLVESLEDPFLIIDAGQTVADCNPGFLSLVEVEKEKLLGRGADEVYGLIGLKEETRRQSLEGMADWECRGRHFEMKTYPVNVGRRIVGVIHHFHDYTVRKQSEQRLRQSLLRLEKLNDLSRLLALWIGKENVIKVTMETATELLDALFGALYFLESGGLKERARTGIGTSHESGSPLGILLEESAFEAITQATTVRFTRPPYNVLAVPLNAEILHGQPGALVFITREETEFTLFDIGLAESVARQLAVTVETARLYREVERLAQIDGLTGVFTRRHFESVASHEWSYAQRHKRLFCIIMADIDHFKKVNDTHGHPAGDAVLRQTADRLRRNLRQADALGRYGGEEFIMLLPGTDRKTAEAVAKRIHDAVSTKPMSISSGRLVVTASFGMSEFQPGTDTALSAIIRRADQALYEAKNSGRNCVRFK